jgi:hypothetical protein
MTLFAVVALNSGFKLPRQVRFESGLLRAVQLSPSPWLAATASDRNLPAAGRHRLSFSPFFPKDCYHTLQKCNLQNALRVSENDLRH